jgi:hypothetical protein
VRFIINIFILIINLIEATQNANEKKIMV